MKTLGQHHLPDMPTFTFSDNTLVRPGMAQFIPEQGFKLLLARLLFTSDGSECAPTVIGQSFEIQNRPSLVSELFQNPGFPHAGKPAQYQHPRPPGMFKIIHYMLAKSFMSSTKLKHGQTAQVKKCSHGAAAQPAAPAEYDERAFVFQV
jgi:hypothetical protein